MYLDDFSRIYQQQILFSQYPYFPVSLLLYYNFDSITNNSSKNYSFSILDQTVNENHAWILNGTSINLKAPSFLFGDVFYSLEDELIYITLNSSCSSEETSLSSLPYDVALYSRKNFYLANSHLEIFITSVPMFGNLFVFNPSSSLEGKGLLLKYFFCILS